MLISVCMCTYKRTSLEKTLRSLCDQEIPDLFSLEVVVVDNDIAESGRAICAKFSGGDVDINYFVNSERNLSVVRNTTIKKAKGDLLAFIDDDEWAEKNWISTLHSALQKYQADVVFGKVDVLYPNDAPEWIVEGNMFGKDNHRTGAVVSKGATSNALLKADWLRQKDIWFDSDFGKTGGEDTDFFHRIHLAGGKLVFENAAIVSEIVEDHRLNLDYLIKQNVRIGQTHWSYLWSRQRGLPFVKTGLFVVAQIIGAAVLMVVNFPFGKSRYARWYLLLVRNLVKLKTATVGSKKVELYGNH